MIALDQGVVAKESDEIRWAPDQHGRWWELRDGEPFTLAAERTCRSCGAKFWDRKGRKRNQKGYCSRECAQKEHGKKVSGERSGQWKGGRMKMRDGYVLVYAPEHPQAIGPGKKYVREHRMVMERELGRLLEPWEQVHHKNGQRNDNRIENLELWGWMHSIGVRLADHHCPGCRCEELGLK